ncbi:MAG: hypothetical protein ACHQU0_03785 [Candidatus Paceibacteria bacterium]
MTLRQRLIELRAVYCNQQNEAREFAIANDYDTEQVESVVADVYFAVIADIDDILKEFDQ